MGNARHGIVFTAVLAVLLTASIVLDRSREDLRKAQVDFHAFGEGTTVLLGKGFSRRKRAALKVGFIERGHPPQVGSIGNHQTMLFARDAFGATPITYFNYWYENVSVIEARDYIAALADRKLLPTELVIVPVTTPNADNGDVILSYHNELPTDWAHYFPRTRDRHLAWEAFFSTYIVDLRDYIRKATDWKTIATNLLQLLAGEKEYLLVAPEQCTAGRASRRQAPTDLLGRLRQFAGAARAVNAFCGDGAGDGYRADGSAIAVPWKKPLVLNENKLLPEKRGLRPGDEREIAQAMRDIDALAKAAGARTVFLIPPVYETDRFSPVDEIMSEALKLARDLEIIDHRKQFRSPRYFENYTHPNEKYFQEVVAELEHRGLLP